MKLRQILLSLQIRNPNHPPIQRRMRAVVPRHEVAEAQDLRRGSLHRVLVYEPGDVLIAIGRGERAGAVTL